MTTEAPEPGRAPSDLRKNLPLIAAMVFVAAMLLRVIGIGWGLPNDLHLQSYHPDEAVNLLYAQQIEVAKGDFEPGFYNYPTLYLTTLRIVSDMTAAYTGGPVAAANDTPDEIAKAEESLWRFLGRATAGGRMVTAILGSATAVVVFFLVLRGLRRPEEELDGPALFGALMGAAAIAFAPAFVVHSRFATVDVPSTFFLALGLLWALRLVQADRETDLLRTALVAGVWTGLAAGTKYNAGLVLLPILAAPWLARRPDALKLNVASIVVSGLVFLATTPGILLNSQKFWQDFNYELGHTATGHGLVFIGTAPGFLYHIQNLLGGFGGLLLLVSIGGLVWAVRAKNAAAILALILIVPYYLVIGRAEVKFMRYTFPLMVGLATGFGLAQGHARRTGGRGHLVAGLGILAVGGIDPGGLRGSAIYTTYMASEDPRDSAARYLKDAESVGLVSDPWFWSPALYPNSTLPRMVGPQRIFGSMAAADAPPVLRYLPENPAERIDWDIRLLTESNPQYVVYSSFEERNIARISQMRPIPEPYRGLVENTKEFIERLEQDYTLDRQFGVGTKLVEDMEYIQPVVWVWKRKDGS